MKVFTLFQCVFTLLQSCAICWKIDEHEVIKSRPKYGGPPTEIGVTMFISNVATVSQENMEYTMSFYFRQHWRDERLINHTIIPTGVESFLNFPQDVATDKIWIPDTFFPTDKQVFLGDRLFSKRESFVRVWPSTGNVVMSLRLTMTSKCLMDFVFFPLDTQKCEFYITSYGHQSEEIVYKWQKMTSSLAIADEVPMTLYELTGYRMGMAKINIMSRNSTYNRLQVEFIFERSRGFYLFYFYIPSALFVILSWITFWIKHSECYLRTTISVMSLFGMCMIVAATSFLSPFVSYTRAIDVYVFTCFLFTSFAVGEYVYIVYVRREGCKAIIYTFPDNCDRCSAVGFLITFLVFNVLYFALYLGLNELSSHVISY